MTNQTITSINLRTDGNPVAICPLDKNNEPILYKSGLIYLNPKEPNKTYQLNCLGLKPFSLRAIETSYQEKLETVILSILDDATCNRPFESINNWKGLQVYLNNVYSGMISFGRIFDARSIWSPEKREIINGNINGDLELLRYSPEVKSDFQKIIDYLETRKNDDNSRRSRRKAA